MFQGGLQKRQEAVAARIRQWSRGWAERFGRGCFETGEAPMDYPIASDYRQLRMFEDSIGETVYRVALAKKGRPLLLGRPWGALQRFLTAD